MELFQIAVLSPERAAGSAASKGGISGGFALSVRTWKPLLPKLQGYISCQKQEI